MYCHKCGANMLETDKYCSNCGEKVLDNRPIGINNSTENFRTASIVLGGLALGGVVLLIFAPISLILAIIGLILAIKSNRNAKNTVGIVLNGISLFFAFILTAIFILFVNIVISVINENDYFPEFENIIENNRF